MKILAVIPARWASTRFPGKPLVQIDGKSMIQRVYEQVEKSAVFTHIVVATDHAGIFEHARAFGATACMTNPTHPSGTDRCAEVAQAYPAVDWVVNIQGDEPFIQPEQFDLLVSRLQLDPETPIATLAKQITDPAQLASANVVKVVLSEQGNALYFSRHAIPYVRGLEQDQWLTNTPFYKHIGLYGFRRDVLLQLSQLPPTSLEKAESLEQLRWLQHGYRIGVAITQLETIGIDTPEDLEFISKER